MNNLVGSIWRHYKGSLYKIHCVSRHTEIATALGIGANSESRAADLVIYEQIAPSSEYPAGFIWARPVDMFFDRIEIEGRKVPRFQKVSN